MANPDPRTDHLGPHQYSQKGDEPLGETIGVRFPQSVDEKLRAMNGKERNDFIRAAVARVLEMAPQQDEGSIVLVEMEYCHEGDPGFSVVTPVEWNESETAQDMYQMVEVRSERILRRLKEKPAPSELANRGVAT